MLPSSPRSAGPLPLTLRLLGPGGLWLGGEALALPTRKALGLVAYLALEGPASRSRLADLFWSENDEESARRNLRRELHRLRETALRERLRADEKAVGLEGPLEIDVARFQALLERGEAEAALGVYRGPLLEGLELPGAAGFAEWLQGWREQLDRQRQRALLYRAENLETRGDWRGALEIHLRLLAEDSLQERHHREVMRLHYLLGEREAALERFERLKGTLRQELGLEPLPETLHLVEQIRAARAPQPAPPAPQGPPPALPLRPPLVGREAAWERMEAAWAARQLVVLTGEPGVGKSRLARDFALSKGPLQTNRGRPTDPGVPFATLSRAVREMLQENPGLELPAWARLELSRLVPELGERPPPPLRSQEERLRLYEAFAELCDLATRDKAALFSDDVQFFDTASLEMGLYALERFRERGGGRGLLAAFRKGELRAEAEALLRSLLESGQGVLIELEPLAEPQLLELVRRISGSGEGRLFSRRLYRATAGNPFFVLETLKTLFESGLLSVNAQGGWETPYDEETTDYRELPVPASVREAVLRRVSNLGEAARRLLEAASLAGDGFRPETLQGATALTEWEALEALERAAEARILEAMPTGGYRFTHDLFAQSLAEALSPERRRLLHLKLAAGLERLGGEPARIAEHLEQAGKPREAASWFVKAARVAEKLYAWGEARNLYGRALELGLNDREAFQAHAGRFDCWYALRDSAQPSADLEAMQQIATRLADPLLVSKALAEQVSFFHATDQYDQALSIAQQLLAQPDLPPERRVQVLHRSADVLTSLGRLEEARSRYLEGLDLLAGEVSYTAGVLQAALAVCCWYQGDYQAAAHHNNLATRIYATVGYARGEVRTLATSGIIATSLGETDQAIGFFERAIVRARETGFPVLLYNALTNLIEIYLERAEFDRAKPLLEEAFAVTRPMNRPSHTAQLLTQHSALHRGAGQLGEAITAAREAIRLVDGVGELNARVGHRLILAGLLLELGDVQATGEALREVAGLFGEKPHQHRAEFETLQARLESLRAPAAALERLEALRGSGASFDHVRENFFWQAKARILLALGDPQRALEAAAQAEDSPTLPTLFLRLAAHALLGSVDPDLLAEAERQLEQHRLPPLEALELRRALADAYAALGQAEKARLLRQEAARMVGELAQTLADHPETRQAFLDHNRDPGW